MTLFVLLLLVVGASAAAYPYFCNIQRAVCYQSCDTSLSAGLCDLTMLDAPEHPCIKLHFLVDVYQRYSQQLFQRNLSAFVTTDSTTPVETVAAIVGLQVNVTYRCHERHGRIYLGPDPPAPKPGPSSLAMAAWGLVWFNVALFSLCGLCLVCICVTYLVGWDKGG